MFLLIPLLLLSLPPPTAAVRVFGAGNTSDSTDGAQPLRYEINDFSQSGASWDLYIQALSAVQARNQSDSMSYFAISGIHGWPQVPWDGVSGNGSYPGFCMHSCELFPTWHRPYLALFEQIIWQEAQTIAATYPSSSLSEYQSAAESLRLPYWDSVANPSLPNMTTTPQITINAPSGQATIANPLYNYTFQGSPSDQGFPSGSALSSFQSTVRCWNGSESNQTAANANLQAGAASNLALAYRFFTTVDDYITFCTAAQLPNQTSNSGTNIENVHNNIHNSVGGFGHMTDPTFAAFDPIFWLHHVNVDRQLGLWQALHPDSFVQVETNGFGSYYEPEGSTDTPSTVLAPFHNTDDGSTMWTSDGIRSLATFRYSYPELPYWSMSTSDLQTYVRNKVNELYNPNSTSSTSKRSVLNQRSGHSSRAGPFGAATGFQGGPTYGANNAERQWFAKINLEKYAADTAFTILLFFGEPPADKSQWSSASNLVGTFGSFIAINSSSMFPDGSPSGKVTGEIALTHALLDKIDSGTIPNLAPHIVMPQLEEGLKWRVQSADGQEIDLGSLSGLSVHVGSRAVDPATTADQFPDYGPIDWHSRTHFSD